MKMRASTYEITKALDRHAIAILGIDENLACFSAESKEILPRRTLVRTPTGGTAVVMTADILHRRCSTGVGKWKFQAAQCSPPKAVALRIVPMANILEGAWP